jgi:hypothetical protein
LLPLYNINEENDFNDKSENVWKEAVEPYFKLWQTTCLKGMRKITKISFTISKIFLVAYEAIVVTSLVPFSHPSN